MKLPCVGWRCGERPIVETIIPFDLTSEVTGAADGRHQASADFAERSVAQVEGDGRSREEPTWEAFADDERRG